MSKVLFIKTYVLIKYNYGDERSALNEIAYLMLLIIILIIVFIVEYKI